MDPLMHKVLGSHTVKDKTMAVLECGHEVPYSAVKWSIPDNGGVPEGMAKCDKAHEAPAAAPPAAKSDAAPAEGAQAS